MSVRNSNVEFWRCFCMFFIVFGHVIINNHLIQTNGVLWHIPGFLFITGYFGVRFRFVKLLRLIGIAYACYLITLPLHWQDCTVAKLVLPHGGWFLPFYCILMLLAPLLNAAIDGLKDSKIVLYALLTCVFLGWLPQLFNNPHLNMIVVPGMQGHGLLLVIVTYVFGRIAAEKNIASRLSFGSWVGLFVIGCGVSILAARYMPKMSCTYGSPIFLATAFAGFNAALRAPTPPLIVSRTVNFVSRSMFSVYLVHECCVRDLQIIGAGSGWGEALLRSVELFALGIAVDVIRQAIVRLCVPLKWR